MGGTLSRAILIPVTGLALLSACQTLQAPPQSAQAALNAYYDTIPDDALPRAPEGRPLPGEDMALTRILVGSCNDEEIASPTLAQVAREEADLFLMIGDNVYGDRDGRDYANNQADLTELRESFSDLARRPEFQAVRSAHPMMTAWDDHDYGANDAGREFPFKGLVERVHEVFWGLEDEDVGQWPGTYHARIFGPQGRRVQVIMLDTRFFRSPLTASPTPGEPGRERYIPAPADTHQDMLGSDQWTWLQNQLEVPADLRLIVSSIQVVTTDGHGYEHWNNLPVERDRLYGLIETTGAEGVVFVSGDRHAAFLYRKEGVLPYPVHEITASSLNLSFREETEERDTAQIGAGYAKENFGAISIDWASREVALTLHASDGTTVRETRFALPESD